jgi:predicted dehydrogenase
LIDLARYFCGEIAKVYAAAALRALQEVENNNVPDVTTVTVEFKSGAIGCMNTACLASQGGLAGLHIITNGLTLELGATQLVVREPHSEETINSAVNGHNEADKAFVAAVRARDQSIIKSSYADAVKTLAVTLAANRSFRTGKPVTVC